MRHNLPILALCFCGTLALPAGQARAQVDCDSIRVDSIRYAPFGDGLQISLFNQNTHFLSGPTVDVWDAAGDTLGQGFMEFFVLFEGPSLHQVHFTPQPPTPFTGTVVLHYNDGEGQAQCELAVTDVDLCPPVGCVPVAVFAYQQPFPFVDMELVWNVTDADNAVVESGVLQMDAGSEFGWVTTTICVLPGTYSLHMAQPVPAGTGIVVGLTPPGFGYTEGISVPLPVGGDVDLPFDYYLPCMDGTQGIASPQVDTPTLVLEGRILRITANSAAPLGDLVVLDPMGRLVHRTNSPGPSAHLDLGGLSSGAYLLCRPGAGNRSAQRFVLR